MTRLDGTTQDKRRAESRLDTRDQTRLYDTRDKIRDKKQETKLDKTRRA